MCMKNRLCRMSESLLGAALLLSTCGLTYSCSDDLDLSNTKPGFLKGSIYDELKSSGKYTNVTRMIDDLGLKEVLSKTGSRTLFVADDDAYAKFYQTTTWTDGNGNPVRDYSQLSTAQKKLLINGSMLDNAYLLEMMPNLGGSSIVKNQCLRQVTSASITDSVPYFLAADLPRTYSLVDKDYWSRYNGVLTSSRPGLYLALDNTTPMMTHFMRGQMKENDITNNDVAFVLGEADGSWPETEERNYIYNIKVNSTGQDVTCVNGYYDNLESVLVTPPNMAEVIRTNGNTKIFSHLLDRFSAPFYDAGLTTSMHALGYATGADSLFVKRYFSERSQGGNPLSVDPQGNSFGTNLLSFDPGWNQYSSSSAEAGRDMAVMFVPSDDALTKYFTTGGGSDFINRYGQSGQDLLHNIDQIPLKIIKELINNLMKTSFNASVPSKYLTIMNDARDRMFYGLRLSDGTTVNSLESYKKLIDKTVVANNGVVYIMNQVVTPAAYAAVSAPALISNDTRIVNAVVTADDNYIQGSTYSNAPLKQYFSTYLKAMQSRFSFFIPRDEGLATTGYVDPAAFSVNSLRSYWRMTYDSTSKAVIPVKSQAYSYITTTGRTTTSLGTSFSSKANDLTTGYGLAKKNMLIEMLNQCIVVHGNSDSEASGVQGDANYYLSRSGAPVFIKEKGGSLGVGMKVQSGFQIFENNNTGGDEYSTVLEGYNKTRETNSYGNGYAYIIDKPLQPTVQSVYDLMNSGKNKDQFTSFLKLCTDFDTYGAEVIRASNLLDAISANYTNATEKETAIQNEITKYSIFQDGKNYGGIARKNVRLFNNYRYTVYVPTNEKLDAAIAAGLPTWESISNYITAHKNTEGNLSDADKAVVGAQITYLVNFLKYHFQDNSVFVDNVTNSGTFDTSCINEKTNTFLRLNVSQTPGTLTVTDNSNRSVTVTDLKNLFARDMVLNGANTSATFVTSSSYVVVHQISDVLHFNSDFSGSYAKSWSSATARKAFMAKYRIRK